LLITFMRRRIECGLQFFNLFLKGLGFGKPRTRRFILYGQGAI
jgi:hypothetical protein